MALGHTVSLCRPFCLRRLRTALPQRSFILFLNPCFLLRLIFDFGFKLYFIVFSFRKSFDYTTSSASVNAFRCVYIPFRDQLPGSRDQRKCQGLSLTSRWSIKIKNIYSPKKIFLPLFSQLEALPAGVRAEIILPGLYYPEGQSLSITT